MPDQPTCRWNRNDLAAAYDAAAMHIHPYYLAIQDLILEQLRPRAAQPFMVVDLGGGSGRLLERALDRYQNLTAVLVDQSEPFLALARGRLARFGARAACLAARLQDDWGAQLPGPPAAIVSMSAIHHLDSAEKAALHARCRYLLPSGGVFLNGDEVRPDSDAEYLAACQDWVAHRERVVALGLVAEPMAQAHREWEERNLRQFGAPRASGDDCHETAEAQLASLRAAGFASASVIWRKKLWAVLRGLA